MDDSKRERAPVAQSPFDISAAKMAREAGAYEPLGDNVLPEEPPISFQFGEPESTGENESSLTSVARQNLQTAPEKKKRDALIRRAILSNGYTIDQIVHVFNIDRQTATQIFYKVSASATVRDFNWPAEFVEQYKRAAKIKLMVEGVHSDDPKLKMLALKAISLLGPESADPTEMQPSDSPQSKQWERVKRIGGDVALHEVLDTSQEK